MAMESVQADISRQNRLSDTAPRDPKTQEDLILAWLKAGRTLTGIDALQKFGCFRLAARIHHLNQRGAGIQSEMIRTLDGARVARYWLA